MRVALATLAICVAVGAWPGEAGARPFRKGPYLQNVSRRSVTVLWESDDPVPGELRVVSVDPPRVFEVGSDELHEVVIDRLRPGRRYRFAIDCDGQTIESEFATAPESGAPISFVVLGDTRSNAGSHSQVIERIRREVPDFILNTGDLVDDGARDRQWQQFFDVERALLRENVVYPSLGNHDRQGRGRTADNFRKYFSLPENSPDPERYYAFTYGSARVLVLDSNAYSFSLTDQTSWIEQQLQAARLDPDIEHVFVSMHHPPFSVALHGGQRELRERWTPLFEEYGVAAVFSGHDHVYSRAERNGVRYFVSGGGGAPLYPRGRRPSRVDVGATRYFERVNHYLRVSIIGTLVEVSAIRSDGTVIETTSWGDRPRPLRRRPVMVAAAGASAGDDAARPPPEVAPHAAALREPRRGAMTRFGLLGKLGAVLVLLAGGVLVWTLRS